MGIAAQPAPVPRPDEVRRICAIGDPVLRNLEITYCYHRLSLAMTARIGLCANWCTFATWASKQAGRTIRGEDWMDAVTLNTVTGSALSHPIRTLWRFLLRRGLLQRRTLLGRIVEAVHSPFDALERASDAVARGNLKVFEEIGLAFASYLEEPGDFHATLRAGPPPDGQDYLRSAFARYSVPEPAAQAIFFANVETGLHEQTRLQSEIQESLETAPATAGDLGRRMLQAIYPGARNWKAFVERPFAAMLAPIARGLSAEARNVTRRLITASLMTLALPDTTLALGRTLDRAPAAGLTDITDPELQQLFDRFACDANNAVGDWADLEQRMRFIIALFRGFHDCADLLVCPFADEQLQSMRAGVIPAGRL